VTIQTPSNLPLDRDESRNHIEGPLFSGGGLGQAFWAAMPSGAFACRSPAIAAASAARLCISKWFFQIVFWFAQCRAARN
jgi:hypothetical protein